MTHHTIDFSLSIFRWLRSARAAQLVASLILTCSAAVQAQTAPAASAPAASANKAQNTVATSAQPPAQGTAQTPALATNPTANANIADRAYTFAGRELLSKFSLTGDWVEADSALTLASTNSRLVPRGQTAKQYRQRITVQELPAWVNPARLGKEYINDIMDDCITGSMSTIEKGNVSQFATDVLVLECIDNAAQTVKLAYAALVQGPRSNLVFSRVSVLPLKAPNAAAAAQAELATFKQVIGSLFVCSPAAPKLCQ